MNPAFLTGDIELHDVQQYKLRTGLPRQTTGELKAFRGAAGQRNRDQDFLKSRRASLREGACVFTSENGNPVFAAHFMEMSAAGSLKNVSELKRNIFHTLILVEELYSRLLARLSIRNCCDGLDG